MSSETLAGLLSVSHMETGLPDAKTSWEVFIIKSVMPVHD